MGFLDSSESDPVNKRLLKDWGHQRILSRLMEGKEVYAYSGCQIMYKWILKIKNFWLSLAEALCNHFHNVKKRDIDFVGNIYIQMHDIT